ncbi:MAG: hypothetical protein HDS65_09735 [Bacteroidales bacterium]|nr:hypothetical protein [Bacteroidales bacterium]
MKLTRLKAAMAAIIVAISATAAESADSTWTYVPKFNGVTRIFYHLSTTNGDSRFEVANARLSAGGNLMPWFEYFMQVDFCANGKIKPLDFYADITPTKGLKLFLGQMRVPFCIDACRAVHEYYFTSVATTSTFGNLRAVGAKAGYTIPGTKLYVEGGIFSSTDMADHTKWNSTMTYAIKANWATRCGLLPEVGFMSRVPGGAGAGVRVNQYDVSLSWKYSRLFIEGEYIYRRYAGSPVKPAHAYYGLVDYAFPLRARMADKLSVQARYDGITDTTSGLYGIDGLLLNDIEGYRRLTFGVTASKTLGRCFTAFKLNYEQYFDAITQHNQVVAGVIFHF